MTKPQITPQPKFFFPILLILDQLGGRADVSRIKERLKLYMKGILCKTDYDLYSDEHEIWWTTARGARQRLIYKGFLRPSSRHSSWELADKGRARLKRNLRLQEAVSRAHALLDHIYSEIPEIDGLVDDDGLQSPLGMTCVLEDFLVESEITLNNALEGLAK